MGEILKGGGGKVKSYSEISKATHISISHVSRVLRKKRKPSLRVLLLLSKEMGIATDVLIKRLGLKGVNRW